MRRYNKINVKRIIKILLIIISIIVLKKPIFTAFNYVKTGTIHLNDNLVNFKSIIYDDIKNFKTKIDIVSNSAEYIKKIEEKERKYQKQEFDLKRLKNVVRENLELRNLLEIKKDIKYETTVAEVKLVEDAYSNDVMYIKKGSNDNIENGQIVIYSGSMIGIIEKTFPTYSKVKLLVNKDTKISVILNDSYLGILRGNGNGTFSVKNYNTDINDYNNIRFEIKTSGISDFIIKDIYIGTYGIRDIKEFKETKELVFKPEYKYANINFVLVIKEVKK
ncbi:rod shape-determining protein MreC [Oceanivirga salmonicida]|uniref:rod shape-determining protein MreC n=1 Tax=Oceanivirga salmonicida TaxID=1769291 RepID=UPI00082E97F6|nr:rod shape-determining protein MreC [Oceanivirga salmonicida]